MIVILETEIRLEKAVLEKLREQIRSIRKKVIAFISKIIGVENVVDVYEESIEKAEDRVKPETKLERLIANNIAHGIDPLERIKENIGSSMPKQRQQKILL